MNRVLFSSTSDHWATPAATYNALNAEFGFTFDPCPLMSQENGAKIKWLGRAYCNPPYSRIKEFITKGLFHLAEHDCELLVFLLPARTDTGWFHEYCMKADEIRFIKGRLTFGNAKANAPFPSMVVVFRQWDLTDTGGLYECRVSDGALQQA